MIISRSIYVTVNGIISFFFMGEEHSIVYIYMYKVYAYIVYIYMYIYIYIQCVYIYMYIYAYIYIYIHTHIMYIYVYIPHLLYPFICWWTFRLLPCPGYCKLLLQNTFFKFFSFSLSLSFSLQKTIHHTIQTRNAGVMWSPLPLQCFFLYCHIPLRFCISVFTSTMQWVHQFYFLIMYMQGH